MRHSAAFRTEINSLATLRFKECCKQPLQACRLCCNRDKHDVPVHGIDTQHPHLYRLLTPSNVLPMCSFHLLCAWAVTLRICASCIPRREKVHWERLLSGCLALFSAGKAGKECKLSGKARQGEERLCNRNLPDNLATRDGRRKTGVKEWANEKQKGL